MSFMGRYSEPLAARFADLAVVRRGQRVLDVGCGPGALTAELVDRLGLGAVCAVDPSPAFAAAVGQRLPGIEVAVAAAERLPFPDVAFDAALAQLVVHFMADPVAGLHEMGRVTREGGTVAACVWDHGGDRGPLTTFWRAVRDLDPSAPDESGLAGVGEGQLAGLFAEAGLDSDGRHRAHRPGPARHVRRVVAALHARGRAGRGVRGVADRRAAPPAARALPGTAERAGRRERHRVGGDRPPLTGGRRI